ncbi:MAG: helix-turn-helix domain-containing protein [Nakamurella sp.]
MTVVVLTGAVPDGAALLEEPGRLSPLVGLSFTAELDGALQLLVSGGLEAATDTASRIAAAGIFESIGISAPASYGDIAGAYRQATAAAEFGRRHGSVVTEFGDIATSGIAGLVAPEQARAFAEALLGPLLEHDRNGRGDLVQSLRTWLAHHGQWDPAATALGVHRHTMRHRMNTVEQLIGRSLDAPGTRSELWLGLEMLDPPG